MAKDPRQRNQKHFSTAEQQTQQVEWANYKQEEAFWYGPWPLCISGGFGSAKTYALCLKALWLSSTYPNNRGLIARKVAKELERTTLATFFKICPPAAYDAKFGGRRADSENILKLADNYGGSTIYEMHLDDEDIEGVIRGLEINWFVIDQAEEIREELFDMLLSRLGRWDKAVVPTTMLQQWAEASGGKPWPHVSPAGLPIPPTYPMIACNPDVETHWIYRRFHPDSPDYNDRRHEILDPQTGQPTGRKQSYKDMGYKLITMSSLENKFLPLQNRMALLASDESFKRRFVHGLWGIPEGQVHRVPDEAIVGGTPELVTWITKNCTLHRSLDHGDASPTCCLWWAVTQSGDLICYREYYKANALISEHRANIADMSGRETYMLDLADPSIEHHSMQKHNQHWSVAQEYADSTHITVCEDGRMAPPIYWQMADNREKGSGVIQKINEYLRLQGTGEYDPNLAKDKPRVHPFRQELGYWPRLWFIKKSDAYPEGCHHAIQQLRAQRYIKVGTENGRPVFSDERDESIVDHAYDPIKYFLASQAPPPTLATIKMPRNSFMGVRKSYLDAKRRGRFKLWAKQASHVRTEAR